MNKYNTDNDKIFIDFSRFNFCFRCVTINNYTNKLKDYNEFLVNFKIIVEKDIPFFSQYTFDEINKKSNKHSHNVKQNTKEYLNIIDIVKELYTSMNNGNFNERDFELFMYNHINDYNIWQLGVSSGIRMFGIRNSNIFHVLFIDYHHLIYPSIKYNDENYLLNKFCPMTNINEEDYYGL